MNRVLTFLPIACFVFAACSSDNNGGTDAAAGADAIAQSMDATGGSDSTSGGLDSTSGGMDSTPGVDASSGPLAFGAQCDLANDQCDHTMSLVCKFFMQLGNVCSKMCTVPADCPAGSMGQKCNTMGYCRP
jgi:hypothetical protein